MSYDDWVSQLVAWGHSDSDIGNLTAIEISALASKLAYNDRMIAEQQNKIK
jgi:hypothetical protein